MSRPPLIAISSGITTVSLSPEMHLETFNHMTGGRGPFSPRGFNLMSDILGVTLTWWEDSFPWRKKERKNHTQLKRNMFPSILHTLHVYIFLCSIFIREESATSDWARYSVGPWECQPWVYSQYMNAHIMQNVILNVHQGYKICHDSICVIRKNSYKYIEKRAWKDKVTALLSC